jgi:murein DD-endopeptidase MepM/ murein hydrolase activator NlpD
MKTILTILFTMSFFGNAFAIECNLPLCKKFQKRASMFKEMDDWAVKKVSFTRPEPVRYAIPEPVKKVSSKLFWPLSKGRISSHYGYRKSPFTGQQQHHSGLDIAAPRGRIIRAAGNGVVIHSGWMQGGCGIGLVINHGDYETVYCHTSKVLVSKGDRIKRGQRIGHVGSTGRSTGPHLHFEIRKGNKSYNPLNFLG